MPLYNAIVKVDTKQITLTWHSVRLGHIQDNFSYFLDAKKESASKVTLIDDDLV
jgi:hypothetical protein